MSSISNECLRLHFLIYFLFIWPVFQDVSWLAVEFFADGFKGGEADGFGLAGFEDGEVGCGDADFVG